MSKTNLKTYEPIEFICTFVKYANLSVLKIMNMFVKYLVDYLYSCP